MYVHVFITAARAGLAATLLLQRSDAGPLLEEQGKKIGVVRAIAAPASATIKFEGHGGHAGGQLMHLRCAALGAYLMTIRDGLHARLQLRMDRAAISMSDARTRVVDLHYAGVCALRRPHRSEHAGSRTRPALAGTMLHWRRQSWLWRWRRRFCRSGSKTPLAPLAAGWCSPTRSTPCHAWLSCSSTCETPMKGAEMRCYNLCCKRPR